MTEKNCESGLILKNRQLAGSLYELVCHAPALARAACPGQFVMLAVEDSPRLFLRRPFGFSGIEKEEGVIHIYYQVVGQGTRQMSGWEVGRSLDMLGPLGRGFHWEAGPGTAVLIGGGMGIGPLLPLAQALRQDGKDVIAFLGAASLDKLFGMRRLMDLGCRVQIATEDGSAGHHGFITIPLEQYLSKASSPAALYACGPTPFLQATAALGQRFALPLQLSMEERMGCGIGVCMGCVVTIKDSGGHLRNSRVCYEGPVFSGEEVVFHG